jgi:hypothetical protein
MKSPPLPASRIHLTVDRLILNGFGAGDAAMVSTALEAALREQLANSADALAATGSRVIPRLSARAATPAGDAGFAPEAARLIVSGLEGER